MMWTGLLNQRGGKVWRVLRLVAVVVLGVIVALPVGAFAGQPVESDSAVPVVFEGEPIDLKADWGDAGACLIWNDVGVAECFRNEAAMDARIAELRNSSDFLMEERGAHRNARGT